MSEKYLGKAVGLHYAISPADTPPESGDWLPVGALRTKSLKTEWDTVDVTADDSAGRVREMLVSYQTVTIDAGGVCRKSDATGVNQIALQKHAIAPQAANGGEPTCWMKITYPDITIVAYMLIKSCERTGEYDGAVEFSLSLEHAGSPSGVIITDTPQV